jgi:BMFP domain-containing protein YqiC
MATNGERSGAMAEETRMNFGAVDQRIRATENQQSQFLTQFNSFVVRVEGMFNSLSSKIEERSRPQYALLVSIGIFGLSVLTAVGWLAYAPIRENQTDQKAATLEIQKAIVALVQNIGEKYVTTREQADRSSRTRADIDRLNSDIGSLEANMRRDQASADGNLQRQIDELKKQFGELYSPRDAFQQLQRRIDALEARQLTKS